MKSNVSVLGALITALACGLPAHAATVAFQFSSGNGSGIAGVGRFTIAPNVAPADPDPGCGAPGANPCRTDPPGAYKITGVSGTFSDPTHGISNAAITGLIPIQPANERDLIFDALVPASLSFFDYPPGGYLTYNNLYFPDGSPIDCNFPFAGTFVDVFGAAFSVAGGYTVDLWGDGDLFGPGTQTYGVGLTDGKTTLAYEFAGVQASSVAVPEPSSWILMLAGFGGLGIVLRRGRSGAFRSAAQLAG